MADPQWFFAKSKVPISLAVTESSTFLDGLQQVGILSEEESLELQADHARSDDQVVYDSLCCIEEKSFSLQTFFEHLFQKPNLKKYPNLKPVYRDFRHGKFQNKTEVTTDVDKDRIIFAQDKVKICLAIKHIFPFVHGLQDLTLLSETESLKLQADKRPVSRVVYECLSLIEKKDLKLNVIFEYIFQECYLRLYPCLQDILQEPSSEHAGLFNGQQYPVFSNPNDLKNFFEQSKMDICQSISERFPFLHGLHDLQLLSRLQLLRLQADKATTKDVLYKALCQIRESSDIETFFVYAYRPFFLTMFPSLKAILQRLNEALREDAYPLPTGSFDKRSHKMKPASEQPTSAGYRKHMLPEVSPEKSERSHKQPSTTRPPEKRPMTDEAEDNKIKIYRCDYEGCTLASTDRSEFKVHRRKHKEERPYLCSIRECSRRFDSAERLARHLLKHTGIKSYPCPKCNKCFSHPEKLASHLKSCVVL
ncbi:uncharacterized protein [Hyperolius riggenbachi]|uniref:uncharacterized protein n=1 Tax=Hyperolius riggenbachi TaxID=752182 RepID=UPI0035A29E03